MFLYVSQGLNRGEIASKKHNKFYLFSPIPKQSSEAAESQLIIFSSGYHCEEKLPLVGDLYSLMHWKTLFPRHS